MRHHWRGCRKAIFRLGGIACDIIGWRCWAVLQRGHFVDSRNPTSSSDWRNCKQVEPLNILHGPSPLQRVEHRKPSRWARLARTASLYMPNFSLGHNVDCGHLSSNADGSCEYIEFALVAHRRSDFALHPMLRPRQLIEDQPNMADSNPTPQLAHGIGNAVGWEVSEVSNRGLDLYKEEIIALYNRNDVRMQDLPQVVEEKLGIKAK